MKKTAILLTVLLSILLLGSCSPKRLTYLQDMDPLATYQVQAKPETRIGIGDKLSITVTCSNPALAAPFSIVSGVSVVDPVTGEISMSDSQNAKSYTVDKAGNINFPVLGKIHVLEYTIEDLEAYIAYLIVECDYIKDPVVIVEFSNFQITMLGEIGVGNYIIENGSVNILEAIALGGDLTEAARRDKVWVIRTTEGTRKVIEVNLLSKSLYDSEAFYLQQGDVLYVKPRKTKLDSTSQLIFTTITTCISLLTSLGTIGFLVSKF